MALLSSSAKATVSPWPKCSCGNTLGSDMQHRLLRRRHPRSSPKGRLPAEDARSVSCAYQRAVPGSILKRQQVGQQIILITNTGRVINGLVYVFLACTAREDQGATSGFLICCDVLFSESRFVNKSRRRAENVREHAMHCTFVHSRLFAPSQRKKL